MSSHLPLEEIGYDQKYYPRVNGEEDWRTVLRYTNTLQSAPGMDFDPVVVVKAIGLPVSWMLLDGLHRLKAYHRAKRTSIPAIIERLPRNRWMARSLELNIKHGRALDDGDKAWCAIRLRDEGMSDEKIAQLLCEPVERLEKIIADRVVPINTTTAQALPRGRSSREVGGKYFGFLKAPFIEQDLAPSEEIEALRVQQPVASMNVINVLDSAVALLSAGVDMTRQDVVERIENLYRLTKKLRGQ